MGSEKALTRVSNGQAWEQFEPRTVIAAMLGFTQEENRVLSPHSSGREVVGTAATVRKNR